MEYQDQVAIVTGSSKGIGAATARMLASRGAKVVVNYASDKTAGEAVVSDCKAAGGDAILIQADVSKKTDCDALVQKSIDTWGQINCLINNAGTTKFADAADLDALSEDDFQSLYALNTVGAYAMVRAARPHLAKHNGRIVNVSSIAGLRAVGSSLAYVASKFALNGLTMGLARSLGADGIKVNAICPGFVATDWFRNALGEEAFQTIQAAQARATPLGRVATAEDVAHAICFLASPMNLHMTGQLILLDGGVALGQPLKIE